MLSCMAIEYTEAEEIKQISVYPNVYDYNIWFIIASKRWKSLRLEIIHSKILVINKEYEYLILL